MLSRCSRRWFDRKLQANAEQCRAVTHIMTGMSRPAPYLIFGPPGTGKTVTMVEAIKQVSGRRPGPAPGIAAHLLKILSSHEWVTPGFASFTTQSWAITSVSGKT